MPTSGEAKAAAHNAGFSVVEAPPTPAPYRVENADGWTIGASSPEELRDVVTEKLRQAEQSKADADAAIAHWRAVAKAAK